MQGAPNEQETSGKHSLMHAAGVSKCIMPWEEMEGTERVRTCPRCNAKVYSLAGLSTDEIIELVQMHEVSTKPFQLHRRGDGKFMLVDGSRHKYPAVIFASALFILTLTVSAIVFFVFPAVAVVFMYNSWLPLVAMVWSLLGYYRVSMETNSAKRYFYCVVFFVPVGLFPLLVWLASPFLPALKVP